MEWKFRVQQYKQNQWRLKLWRKIDVTQHDNELNWHLMLNEFHESEGSAYKAVAGRINKFLTAR